ncbi:MAG: hypothetical protein V2I97_07185 [Desulfococcaceae bacterium]|jgi:hypothetical protein|nr:hypothetical protein [Desulfococcaceae bacterium]
MGNKKERIYFNAQQLREVEEAVSMSEELVSDAYKMSASQWLRSRYDVKTLADLQENEIASGRLAQVIRYEIKRKDISLGSASSDFYKICLQDHAILARLRQNPELKLFPFSLYIVTHELIHIVRFCKFLQHFDASPEEKKAEEIRVDEKSCEIMENVRLPGIGDVLHFFRQTREPVDELR